MPFDQFIPRRLTPVAVHAYAPTESGVYGISNAREWIYIGETDNIQGALLNHLQGSDTPVTKREPTGFVWEVCDPARRPARQDRLVLEYEPTCNRHSPPETSPAKERRGNHARSAKMQFILTGFTQDMGFRVFAFERMGEDRIRTKYAVRADLALIQRYGIRLQELPLLCRRLLERRDNGEKEGTLTFTEDEMSLYAKDWLRKPTHQKDTWTHQQTTKQ
jgi:hypothetical protein